MTCSQADRQGGVRKRDANKTVNSMFFTTNQKVEELDS
jgi:hypothetical protein